MFPDIDLYCLPSVDSAPIAFTASNNNSNSQNKTEFEVKLKEQEKFKQVLLFTDGHWPKEHFDVEVDIVCQTGESTSKLCTLTREQRCFLWSDTNTIPASASLVFKATLSGSSLSTPQSPVLTKLTEGEEMKEINEKTPEVTVACSPKGLKGKRKSEKENALTTPKLKLRRQQVSMRGSAKKSPLNKVNKNSPIKPSTNDKSDVENSTAKITNCVNLSSREPKPSRRWGHTMCMVNDNMAVLIGGQGDKQQFSRDSVWTLNPEMRTWKSSDLKSDGVKPELRVGHTATFDPTMRCIYIFGGSKKSKWFHDVYMYDLDEKKWTLVKANGRAPTRAYHSTTLYRHELWVFGGVYPRPSPQPDASDNEIHIFSPMMEGWYKPIVTGEKPLVRSGHSATLMNDNLVIFGGWDFPFCYNDIHILDLTTVDWSAPEVNGTPPKPRSWHSSSSLSNNRLFIHGGYDGDNALQDAFVFQLDTNTWHELVLHDSPSPRAGHTCIRLMSKYEKEDEDEIIIFGGGDNDDSYFNDMLSIYVPHDPQFV